MKKTIGIAFCCILLSGVAGFTISGKTGLKASMQAEAQAESSQGSSVDAMKNTVIKTLRISEAEAQLIATELYNVGIHKINKLEELENDYGVKTIALVDDGQHYYLTVENGFLKDIRLGRLTGESIYNFPS